MAQKWYNKASVQTALVAGACLIVVAIVSGLFDLKSKEQELEAAPQLTDVVPVAGELPWEAYLVFTVANQGGSVATLDRLRLTTKEFLADHHVASPLAGNKNTTPLHEAHQFDKKEPFFAAYMSPSHTYEPPPAYALGEFGKGKIIEINLDQIVEANLPDKFRVKISVLRPYLRGDIGNITWAIQPTLLTNHGELKGPNLTILFPKPSFGPLTEGEIKWLQNLLAKNGADPGPPDGLFGEKTMQAIRKFQQEVGLHVDGVASRELLLFLLSNRN